MSKLVAKLDFRNNSHDTETAEGTCWIILIYEFRHELMRPYSVFVPSESNPLLDLLLARGPNGESPVKAAPPVARTSSPSPARKTTKDVVEKAPAAKRKGGRAAASTKKPAAAKTTRPAKKGKKQAAEDPGAEEETVAGAYMPFH